MQNLSFKFKPVAPHKANYILLAKFCMDGVANIEIDPKIVGGKYIVRIKDVRLVASRDLKQCNEGHEWSGYSLNYPYTVTPCGVASDEVLQNVGLRDIRATTYNDEGSEYDMNHAGYQWVTVLLSDDEAQEVITAQESIKPVKPEPAPVLPVLPVADDFNPVKHERKKFRKLNLGMSVLVKRDFRKKYPDVMKGSLWTKSVDMGEGRVFTVTKLDASDNTVYLSNNLWYSAADLKIVH